MMKVLRPLLCLAAFAVTVGGECVSSLCDHGSCVNGECQCEPNYSGADCSIPFETCEDGLRTCFNGSTCVRNNERDPVTNKYKYYCDCTKAVGVSSYAGLQCREQATSYCVLGRTDSEYAFCTNGGECIRIVEDGAPHPGCRCSDDFEGQHCQYLKGEAPEEDLGQPYLMYAGDQNKGGLEGFVIFIIVCVCVSVIFGMGYVVYLKKIRGANTTNGATSTSAPPELSLESEVI